MRRALLFAGLVAASSLRGADPPGVAEPDAWTRVRLNIEKYLGRPYGWGTTGLKSFDCSGFVWRVYAESGAPFKRTTARKLWFSLPTPTKDRAHAFGNLIFFDDLEHVGIVNDGHSFYHAQKSIGTNLSPLSPYWRSKVVGERAPPPLGN